MKKNMYDWEYRPVQTYQHAKEDKKANVRYWDSMEYEVEKFIIKMAYYGGIQIPSVLNSDADVFPVKQLTEKIIEEIEVMFPEAEFPYIDEDF